MEALSPDINSTRPPGDQTVAIRHHITSDMQRLSSLNLTIAKLQSTLTDLKLQQNVMKTQLDNHKAIIAPIRRLLPEILREIFIRCLPAAHNAVMSGRDVPLLLCRVCHHWRSIAYTTPQLWSSVHIVIPDDVPDSITPEGKARLNSSQLDAISSWLSRSGALPLSISVSFSPFFSIPIVPTSIDLIQPYFDVLAPFKSRWCSLHLSFPYLGWLAHLCHFSADELPMLESIHISGPLQLREGDTNYTVQQLTPLAKDSGILLAPNLRSIGIPFGGPSTLELPIPWANLTNLDIIGDGGTYNVGFVARTLSLCPKLETCAISFARVYIETLEERIGPLPQVHLPSLHSFSMNLMGSNEAIPKLLASLHTPQLRHLAYQQNQTRVSLDDMLIDRRAFLDSFSIFLGRLVHPLEELELRVKTAADMDVEGVLRLVPGLKRLSLRHTSVSDSVFPRHAPNSRQGSRAYFLDSHLASLTPPKASGEEEKDGVSNGNEPSASGSGNCASAGLDYSYMGCVCPKLEVFHCAGGAFSEAAILDFLHSRCYNPTSGATRQGNVGVERLKKVGILNYLSPGEHESEETRKRIEELRIANPFSVLDVTFTPTDNPKAGSRKPPTPLPSYEGVQQTFCAW